MKMHTPKERLTILLISVFILRSSGKDSPLGGNTSLFSSIVSWLTISTTGANKLPLLQAALVAIFKEVQYILALLIRVKKKNIGQWDAAIYAKILERRRYLISAIVGGTTTTIQVTCFSTSLSVYTLDTVYLSKTPCLIKLNEQQVKWIYTW